MLNKIVQVIIKFLVWLASNLTAVLLTPVYLTVTGLVDNFPYYEDVFINFTYQKFLPAVAFAREVFLNFTGFPDSLFQALVTLFLARLALHAIILPIKFLMKIYYFFRGTDFSGAVSGEYNNSSYTE